MAIFYLIRHGEPDYERIDTSPFYGFGRALAPLSERGILQAEAAAKDSRLKSARFIVSSPYTRALQTAHIISKNTGLEVKVELDLHEWLPDLTNQFSTSEESRTLAAEFKNIGDSIPAAQKCGGNLWK